MHCTALMQTFQPIPSGSARLSQIHMNYGSSYEHFVTQPVTVMVKEIAPLPLQVQLIIN